MAIIFICEIDNNNTVKCKVDDIWLKGNKSLGVFKINGEGIKRLFA